MNRITSTLIAAALLITASQAHAVPIVDQDFTSGCCLGGALAEGLSYSGQSVTAGVSGNLVRVDLMAGRSSGFLTPWFLDIQEMASGVPTGNVLSRTLIDPSDFPVNIGFEPGLFVTLSTPVFFEAGDVFAIVLHPQGVEGFSPGLFAGLWGGDVNSGYLGGTALSGPFANALSPQDFDFHFRTFVTPVPEPKSYVFLLMGLVALRWARRKSFV